MMNVQEFIISHPHRFGRTFQNYIDFIEYLCENQNKNILYTIPNTWEYNRILNCILSLFKKANIGYTLNLSNRTLKVHPNDNTIRFVQLNDPMEKVIGIEYDSTFYIELSKGGNKTKTTGEQNENQENTQN